MKKHLLPFVLLLLLGTQTKAQYYIDNFDTINQIPLVIDSTVGNIWQIGAPHKIFFDSAYSRPNAIATDTIGSYPPNNQSSFTITLGNSIILNAGGLGLIFEHKFDTDTSAAGGYITTSYNGGITWTDIYHDSELQNNGWLNFYSQYDTIAGGIPSFNGHSNGWQNTSLGWDFCFYGGVPHVDSIMIRFNFKSDSINSGKEGWMIDNIEVVWNICEGVKSFTSSDNIELSPNPATNQLTIHASSLHSDKPATVFITNVLGQKVLQSSIFNLQSSINISSLPAGIYFLQLKWEGGSVVKKFVKE